MTPISIDVEYADRVNLAMHHNGVALVERVLLTNTGEDVLTGLTLDISLENDECEPWVGRIERIDPGATYNIEPDGPRLSARALAIRTEADRTAMQVRVTATGASPASKSLDLELLAFDQWPGVNVYPELLGAFITPNHPCVADLLGSARRALGELSDRDALDGYQSGSRSRASQIAEACFNAIVTQGIGYINPPASFERDGQRVRLVDKIMRERLGSCLDLSLLLASLWEQSGLHPLVLLVEGHAMPAVWTHETHLPEPAIDEAARIRNLIELGDIVPVESTLVTDAGASFHAAVEAAKRRMTSPGAGFCAIDVHSCRKRGVRPLALRDDGAGTQVDLNAVESGAPQDAPAAATTVLDPIALAERAEARSEAERATTTEGESANDRIERWKARLLDLSLRNRLINFRETGRTVRLQVPNLAELEDRLAGDHSYSILPRPDTDDAHIAEEFTTGRVFTTVTPAETQKRLLQLFRLAKSSIDETGANLLHLALGMLKWYESDSSTQPRLAPLILLPVRLDRRTAGGGYQYDLRLSNEPLRPNVTLLEKLRVEFGIDTTGLDEMPEDESGIDVPLILRNFRSAIRDTSRWEVEESAFLGLFSFNKFLMWRDLQENIERLRQNKLVVHLVDRAQETFDPRPLPQPEHLDDEVDPGALYTTRDADSTQLAAIRAAADERTFVLEGPPGTGKSQTIANIIADSLGRGKRVLLVAEKMAALSVVSSRLKEDGLGPFCLELHSAKASKKEVLAQLEEGLVPINEPRPANWDALCAELGVTRNRLNTYVRELHERRPSGETLFQVLGRLTHLGVGPRIGPAIPDFTAVESDALEAWRGCVAALIHRSEPIDPPHEHPLRGVGRSDWSFTLPNEARDALVKAEAARRDLSERLADLLDAAGAEPHGDRLGHAGVQAVAVLSNYLLRSPVPEKELLEKGTPTVMADLRELIALGRERDAKKKELLERYREEFLDLDHIVQLDTIRRAAKWPGPIRFFTSLRARRRLRPYCVDRLPDLETLRADLETVGVLKKMSARLAGAAEATAFFGRRWMGGAADWNQLESILEWCEKFTKAVTVLRGEAQGPPIAADFAEQACDEKRLESAHRVARELVLAWNEWLGRWKLVKEVLVTSSAGAFGSGQGGAGWLPRVESTLQRWTNAIPDLNDWCAWRRARASAVENELDELVLAYEQGEITRTGISDVFERGFGAQWFSAVANTVDALREFNANDHTQTIARFRALDEAIIAQTRYEVTARLSKNRPSTTGQAAAQSEMGILRRELEKKRRHLPTRRLIEAMPNLLPRLKPCFLMSPLSVAQYLDAKLPPFDLVVFDEASQIPVWDAVGAIARGAEVIVVGDSKQLPPTSFFNTLDGDDDVEAEDFAVEDMESILKECNASGIPPMPLCWHYRSRHESLIAFSNHHYYDNRLLTFPSPEERSEDLGVTLRYVADGVYDRGGSRTNRIEAGAVVDEIVARLGAPDATGSIGVVTFSQAQQGLIEDLLDERRRESSEIDRFFTNEVPDPVFVKNLENVQGDERDTIIFSVGYGPDQTGKTSMNFGPLNKDGGERRLNVAVTRARERLIVFTSLRPDQIDLRRSRAVGVKHFKTFLDYAQRGPRAIAEAIDYSGAREFESGFEHAVWKALTDRGWDVDTQVGCAGYRVDLAVRDPERPGRFLLGIECDGAAYHGAKTARDRDRLRQSVLEHLGWRIERIWSTDWWIHPERCIEGIERALDDAKQGVPAQPLVVEPIVVEPIDVDIAVDVEDLDGHVDAPQAAGVVVDELSTIYAAAPETASRSTPADSSVGPVPYRRAQLCDRYVRHDIFDRSTTSDAVAALVETVRVEGPIVEELLIRRVADSFGVQRVTRRFRDRFAEILAAAQYERPIRTIGDVHWPDELTPNEFRIVRVPDPDEDDRRRLEHVPLVERVNAVVQVLSEQFGLPEEDLERETAKLLGWLRLTEKASEAMRAAVDAAVAEGRAQRDDGRVSLPAG